MMSILVCSMAFASCSSDVPTAPNEEETGNPQQPGDTEGSVSTVKFSLDFNSLSRANIPVDLDKYEVKVYVYEAVSEAWSKFSLLGNIWNIWDEYQGYTLLEQIDYDGTPISIKLKKPDVPSLGVVIAHAKRYRYNIITVASTKGADALPDVSVGTSLSEQFTKSISNKDLESKDLESIEIFKSNIEILPTGEIDSDGKPKTGGELNIEGLTGDGEYNAGTNNIKAVLKRKSGEVQVTVMKNATSIIPELVNAKTIEVTISYAASAIGFEPITSPVDDKTRLSYDVNLNLKETATIKKSFPVDFNNNNAEVLLLESLPKYIYAKGADSNGIELKLEFKNENGKIINSISVAQEKQFYIFPNTRSTITLGKSGFEFGNEINLDDDSWDGIH
ncbi:hypothetical protein H6A66_09390 [Bacteroides caecigallinarum]|nr:hypothetical protein [Bacteroides caecigallinarum]